MNCHLALSEALKSPTHDNQEIAYDNSESERVVAHTHSYFFNNPHSTLCGDITSCTLYDSGCSTIYSGENI